MPRPSAAAAPAPTAGGVLTFERIQLRELTVVKGNGSKEPFDRDKIARSVQIATRASWGWIWIR